MRKFAPEPSLAVSVAWCMLMHNRTRLVLTAGGIGIAFFLAAAQVGLLVGWIHTCTAIIRHASVDLWVVAGRTPAFDYGTPIPRQRIYQARSVPGVAWAEGLFSAWSFWQRQDGGRVSVQIIGLDKGNVGGPWRMAEGDVACVHLPDAIIVDTLYLGMLQVDRVGQDFEMIGNRVEVGGISSGVRTFTAAPYVFTSLERASRFDPRYRDDEITYVMVRCVDGADVTAVQKEMRHRVPYGEVLTSGEFASRSAKYWIVGTGMGLTVVLTATLGLGVGVVITSQTLFAITQDHLPNYATLLALGFRRASLVRMILAQSFVLGVLGIAGGSALFFPAVIASARTAIPVETTPLVFSSLVVMSLFSCVAASFLSLRTIFNLDPVVVFRQ